MAIKKEADECLFYLQIWDAYNCITKVTYDSWNALLVIWDIQKGQ